MNFNKEYRIDGRILHFWRMKLGVEVDFMWFSGVFVEFWCWDGRVHGREGIREELKNVMEMYVCGCRPTRLCPRWKWYSVSAFPAGPPHVRTGRREGGTRHLHQQIPQTITTTNYLILF